MQHKITAFLTAAMLLCTGCAEKQSSQTAEISEAEQTTVSVTEQTTAESAQTEVTTATDAPLIPMTEPVKLLTALHVPGTVKSVCPGGKNAVSVQYGTGKQQHYAVVDLMNDTVTASGELVSPEEVLLGCTAAGEIVSAEMHYHLFTGTLRVYQNGKSRSIKLADTLQDFSFCAADDCVYAYDPARKCVMKIAADGTETVQMQLPLGSLYRAVCPEQQLLLTADLSAELGVILDLTCRSMQTGEVLWSVPVDDSGAAGFTNGGIYAESLVYHPTQEEGDDPVFFDTFVYTRSGELRGSVRFADSEKDFTPDQTGDFRAAYTASIVPADGAAGKRIRFTDAAEGKFTELDLPVSSITAAVPYYSADTGRWAAAFTSEASGTAITDLCLLNPEQPAQTAEAGEILTPKQHHAVEPELKQARQLADIIEQKYGVRVLIGDEVLDLHMRSDEYTQSTSDYWRETEKQGAGAEIDIPAVHNREVMSELAAVEIKMSKYPDGFFRQFQTPDGRGGVRISIFRALSPYASGDADGIANAYGAWYDMRLVRGAVFDHEMFHLVEFRLNQAAADGTAFPETGADSWTKLNPAGFQYTFYSASASPDIEKYLILNNPETGCFVSQYAASAPVEDRAELISRLLSYMQPEWESYKPCDCKTLFQRCPKLLKKVDYIAERVKKVFGTVYWEDIYAAGFDPVEEEKRRYGICSDYGQILKTYGISGS